MKKFICIMLFGILMTTPLLSQDLITLKTGEKIETKVIEVNPDNIKYKKFSNPSGPTYSLLKLNVESIAYENGEKENFQDGNMETTQSPQSPELKIDVNSFKTKYFLGDNQIEKERFQDIMKRNSESYQVYKNGKTLKTIGTVLTIPSGFLLGYQLGAMAGPELESNTALAIAGGAGTVGGVILGLVGISKMERAINMFNNDSKVNVGFIMDASGLGLTLKF